MANGAEPWLASPVRCCQQSMLAVDTNEGLARDNDLPRLCHPSPVGLLVWSDTKLIWRAPGNGFPRNSDIAATKITPYSALCAEYENARCETASMTRWMQQGRNRVA